MTPAPTDVSLHAYNRKEAAHTLRISVRKLDDMIALGELDVVRLGRRVLITRDAIGRFIRHNETKRSRSGGSGTVGGEQ